MIERMLIWGISRVAGGPGRAWIWTAIALRGLRMVRSATGRRPVVDAGTVRPGQRLIIEHREISHGKQIKQFKAKAKEEKRGRRAAAKAEKKAEKDAKAEEGIRRAAARANRRADRQASKREKRTGEVEGGRGVVGSFRRRSGRRAGKLEA